MSFEKINIIKNCTIVICVLGVVATAAVAMHRVTKSEEEIVAIKKDQRDDRAAIADLRGDVRVIREIVERLDPNHKSKP